jgi:hypothetical protein
MLDPTTAERIRAIFLHAEKHVTIEEAAAMLGRTEAEILRAIDDGDIEAFSTCSGRAIDTRELAEQATHVWPLKVIEEALGRDASMVMPDGLRCRKLAIRVPAFLIQALHILAEGNGEDADALLARELHGLAVVHRERLAARIVDFDECADWPVVDYEKAS